MRLVALLIPLMLSACVVIRDSGEFAPIKLKLIELDEQDRVVFETEHWSVVLNKHQCQPGTAKIWIKEPVGSLAALTEEEWTELHQVIRALDWSVRRAFGATVINYKILMNYAYEAKPYMPLVHVHFRPRYDHDVVFAGLMFTDPEFGLEMPAEQDGCPQTPEIRKAIADAIKRNLPSP